MKIALFAADDYKAIEKAINQFLNNTDDFISERTSSPRSVGDAVESLLAEHLEEILHGYIANYSRDFPRRAMEDIAFTDVHGCYHAVDIKTHRTDTEFNMPNLTSVQRLSQFYNDHSNYFAVLMVTYSVQQNSIVVEDVHFVPIEFLSWECLTIGALGWGQIQIANSNRLVIHPHYSRKQWMLELCGTMQEFYPKEIEKIDKRLQYFQVVRERWNSF